MSYTTCRKCKSELIDCPRCKGRGRVGGGVLTSSYTCKHCNGTGKLCPKHGTNFG